MSSNAWLAGSAMSLRMLCSARRAAKSPRRSSALHDPSLKPSTRRSLGRLKQSPTTSWPLPNANGDRSTNGSTNLSRPSALASLAVLRAPGRGVFASAGPLFRFAVFARDSLEVAEDVAFHDPDLAREIVVTLASLQGESANPVTEEEPGRIPHEYRSSRWDGRPVSAESMEILHELSAKWGGTDDELLYYGSADATPLFVRVAAALCKSSDAPFLRQRIRRRSGEEVSLSEAVAAACEWICRRMHASRLGLLEFKSSNPNGLPIQTWKDSATGIVHTDGTAVNVEDPVATLDLQALALDALRAGTRLLPYHPAVTEWEWLVQRLVRQVPESFWLDDERFFAQAIDRDPLGLPRRVKTRSSEAGVLLGSELLDSLCPDVRREMRFSVASALFGPEFLTDVGIRCRSLEHQAAVTFADYHGAWASWPKDTYDAAKGLARQGFRALARALEDRLLSAVALAGQHVELFYVSPAGAVLYQPIVDAPNLPAVTVTNKPEPDQAWTVSALLSIKRRRTARFDATPSDFEAALLKDAPRVHPPKRPESEPMPSPFTLRIRS